MVVEGEEEGGRGGGGIGKIDHRVEKTKHLLRSPPGEKSQQVTSHNRKIHEKPLTSGAISRIPEPIAQSQTKTTPLLPPLDPVQDSAGCPRAPPEEAFIRTLLPLL